MGRELRIRALVHEAFNRQTRQKQIYQLRRQCGADLIVSLKIVFTNEGLSAILLREYAQLDPSIQGVYRHVSALEAAGARVHRQLIIRTLGVDTGTIQSFLHLAEGLVDEYDIDPNGGIYGWSTRHPVIAQIIAVYKFADQDELFRLFDRVVSGLIPSISVELRTLRDICNSEFGTGRLTDNMRQMELYRRLVDLAPGERIPRHRLIARLIHVGEFEKADHEIRNLSIGLRHQGEQFSEAPPVSLRPSLAG